MGVLDNVELAFDQGNKGIIKIRRSRPGTTLAFIRHLLREGFRGDEYYYRNNDRRLILKVWEKEGLELNPIQRKLFLHEVTMPDTITRRRRELRGEFPESEEVMKKRYKLFEEHLDRHRSKFFTRRLRLLK